MNIAYFSKTRIPSTMANSIQSMQVCLAMTRLNHSVTFFVIAEKNSDDGISSNKIFDFYNIQDCFEIHEIRIPETKGSRLRYIWSIAIALPRVAKILFRGQFDLVVGRDVCACWVSTVFRIRTIYESHAPIWLGSLERLLFRLCIGSDYFTKLVVISESLKKAYLDRYPRLSQMIQVAPDGAEILLEKVERATLQGEPARLNIGYVGNLYKGKGVEIIEAIAPDMPEVGFHIIGGDAEGIAIWEKRISYDNVFFYGFISRGDLPSYYESLDVCLLPNQDRVFGSGSGTIKAPVDIGSFTSPLKLFEYMAYGKAIVASDLPVLREVLHEGIAVLVDPKDFDGWKDAIRSLASKARRENLGMAAKQELETKYTWVRRMEKILECC